tara:strand:- start:306 stop:710 length:405 start_codon:yes stop_codon:yes gene_type:complete
MAISSAAFDDGSDGASKATYTPSRNPNIGVQYAADYTGVLVNQAVGGEIYTVERYGKRKTWTMSYSFLDATDQAKVQALIDYAVGKKTFFYFAEDDFASSGSNSVKVRFNQDVFAFEEVAQGATSITLNIIEQL